MIDDPIVNEVRKIRERIAAECNNNLRNYFEMLRNEDAKLLKEKSKTVSPRSSSGFGNNKKRA